MERLDELKQKYGAAMKTLTETGVHVTNLHVQDNKLFLKGAAPSQMAVNLVWTAIKAADPTMGDVTVDLAIDPSLPTPPQHYTVVSGDTLSKIAKHFYGDSHQYMKIFDANKDTLSDPDKIKVGQVLNIPVA